MDILKALNIIIFIILHFEYYEYNLLFVINEYVIKYKI